MADLAKYVVKLEAQTAKYERELKRANAKLGKFHRQQKQALNSIVSGWKKLSLAVVGAGTAITAATVKTAGELDRIVKAAKDARIGVETFQAWEFAAAQTGVRVQEFSAALGRAQRRVGLFVADGTGPAAKSFQRLGIAVRDANGDVRSQEAIIRDYVKQLGTLQSAQERTAEITALFGDDARRLALVFGNGIEALEAFEQQAKDLGIVIGGDTLRQAENFNDQMDILSRVIRAGLAENMMDISRAIISIANAAIRALPHVTNLFDILTGTQRAQLTIELMGVNAEIKRAEAGTKQALAALSDGVGTAEEIARVRIGGEAAVLRLREKQEAILSKLSALDTPTIRPGGDTPEVPAGSTGLSTDLSATDYDSVLAAHQEAYAAANDAIVFGAIEMAEELRAISEGLADSQVMTTKAMAEEQTKTLWAEIEKQGEIHEKAAENFDNLFTQNLVQAADSGFDSVLKSWAETLKQMVAKLIASKIFDLLAGIGGGGSGSFGAAFVGVFGGARAEGGGTRAGRSYLVGEEGPEIFTPGVSGMITPNGADMGTSITVNAPHADIGMIPRIEQAVARAVAISERKRIDAKRRGA